MEIAKKINYVIEKFISLQRYQVIILIPQCNSSLNGVALRLIMEQCFKYVRLEKMKNGTKST